MTAKQLVLAEYLKARRSVLNPEDLGFPREPGRRVRGLRRQEVADRAGISLDYYVRIEQGHNHQLSEQVLSALARALVLDENSRAYLYRLALPSPRDAITAPAGARVTPLALRMVEQLTDTPTVIFDRNQDIVFVNDLAAVLSPACSVVGSNFVEMIFSTPVPARADGMWQETARASVAALRFQSDPADPRLQQLARELAAADADFRKLWVAHEVGPFTSGIARSNTPEFGWVDFTWQVLDISGGLFMHVNLSEPGTAAGDAITYFASRLRAEGGRGAAASTDRERQLA